MRKFAEFEMLIGIGVERHDLASLSDKPITIGKLQEMQYDTVYSEELIRDILEAVEDTWPIDLLDMMLGAFKVESSVTVIYGDTIKVSLIFQTEVQSDVGV